MFRVTDQYVWNIVFLLFFCALVLLGVFILEDHATLEPSALGVFDITLIALATWRLVRLFLYDTIMKWFREQFWDIDESGQENSLQKPTRGPRRTIADLLSCPWCLGTWAAAVVIFFYLLTPLFFYLVLILAVSSLATLLHNLSWFLVNKTEKS